MLQSNDLLPIDLAAIAFGVFLLIHIGLWHVLPRPRRSVALLFLLGLSAYGTVAFVAMTGFAIPFAHHFWVSAPLYSMLMVMYFHFYFGMDRSVTIRILNEVAAAAPGKRLTFQELYSRYPQDKMIENRIELLVHRGWLAKQDDRYTCTPKGEKMVKITLFFKDLYSLDVIG
jgi:hypothetical protein